MNRNEFLILTKGRAVCLVLDAAIGLMNEMTFDNATGESARQECVKELFYLITQVGALSCGREDWAGVYDFLVEIGIYVPDDFHLEMSYADSMLDVIPGETKCN